MDNLFPERIRALRSWQYLFESLHEQCIRDINRAGITFESESTGIHHFLEELQHFFGRLSDQDVARICYVADVPDTILKAFQQRTIGADNLAESFVRRAALKVITRAGMAGD